MKMDDFTRRVQELLAAAQQEALDNNNQEVYPVHLFKAMLKEDEGVARPLLEQLGLNLEVLESDCQKIIEKHPRVYNDRDSQLYMSQEMNQVL